MTRTASYVFMPATIQNRSWSRISAQTSAFHPKRRYRKKRKTDIEAAAAIGKRVYWLTSHAGIWTPPFFATDIIGQGADSKLKFVGVYKDLRKDLN